MDEVKPAQVRRALARAERGAALDLAEATALLAARGEELDRLCAAAARVRDAGLVAAGRSVDGRGTITYSPKVFIPVTRLCRDRCHYCTFVETPGHAAREGRAPYLSPDEILDLARQGGELGCLEALFTLGDRPEDRWPEAREWLRRAGLRLDAGVRAGDGGPGARGDRPAAAPQPWRHVVGGDEPAQAGLAVHGDDAGDHVHPAVHREGRGPPRLSRQGPGGPACGCSRTPAGCRSRSRPGCWSASVRTSPSGRRRSSRSARSPVSTPASRR